MGTARAEKPTSLPRELRSSCIAVEIPPNPYPFKFILIVLFFCLIFMMQLA
jgi:hypothetical protein